MPKIPEPAPNQKEYLQHIAANANGPDGVEALIDVIQRLQSGLHAPVNHKGEYLYWDKVKHYKPPEGYTSEEMWFALKASRVAQSKQLPFKDKTGTAFRFCIPDPALEALLYISEQASGALTGDPQLADEKLRATHLVSSLAQEAIYSSKIEGATTTRAVAREMLRTQRKPQDVHEKMIVNNYAAMLFIRDHKHDAITPERIFQLHSILVDGTDIPLERVGVLREDEDNIVIEDAQGTVLHEPPGASELPDRLKLICEFANDETKSDFVPPVLRAIIAHFMMGYDHPFFDGNGRTARALFYWIMAREGFWLTEHISISTSIKARIDSYLQACLFSEHDDNDVTYFIMHQLDTIKKGIVSLKAYLQKKADEMIETERAMAGSGLMGQLNHRQLALVKNAIRNPGARYTVKSHQNSHGIVQQTSRTDLLALAENYGLLLRNRVGRSDVYTVPPDLVEKIQGNN